MKHKKDRNITSEKSYRRAEEDELYQSRADIKVEIAKLKALALAISALSNAELAKMPLSEEVLAAIATARKIAIRTDAYSRHQSYLCKLLRSDGLEPIELAYDKIINRHNQNTIKLEKLEGVRDQLIGGGDEVLNNLVETYPDADRQQLRQLIRQANKELAAGKPAKAGKESFKQLRQLAGI